LAIGLEGTLKYSLNKTGMIAAINFKMSTAAFDELLVKKHYNLLKKVLKSFAICIVI